MRTAETRGDERRRAMVDDKRLKRYVVHFTNPEHVAHCMRKEWPCAVQEMDAENCQHAAELVGLLFPGCAVLETFEKRA